MVSPLEARLLSRQPVGDGLYQLSLGVEGTPLARAHHRPGQYIFLSLPGLPPAPFALGNAPGPSVSHYEVLLRPASPLAEALVALSPGEPVQVKPPAGPGYPLEHARGRPLLLAGTGTAISPLMSVLRTLVPEREAYGPVTLLYGTRTAGGFAYAEELTALAGHGVKVVHTVSSPEAGWEGLTGYVQHHVCRERCGGVVAFLAGQPEMVSAVTEALVQEGARREDVFLNV
jgi:NAD(P)H-flavin reductase